MQRLTASILTGLLVLTPTSIGLGAALQEVTPIEAEGEFDALGHKLANAKKEHDRDLFFAQLLSEIEESEEAAQTLEASLLTRWERTTQGLAKAKLEKKFAKLLKHRAKWDEARKLALELIEDETTYFYPYRQPEVSAAKAAEYQKVQQEVNKRVAALREVWTKSPQVKLSNKQRAWLRELAWLQSKQAHVSQPLELPEGMPMWFAWLPGDVKAIQLNNLAMTEKEAARLASDRGVAAYNEQVWKATQEPKRVKTDEDRKLQASFPTEVEREQVRVTNDYRAMLGRGALTWDPRLQEATHYHSEYQTRTGEFGHYQKEEATRTPFQRMRLAGYTRGVSENCAKGYTDPFAALMGWTRSSGHHRNMIMKGHRQMASAVDGDVWTQNYGVGEAKPAGQ